MLSKEERKAIAERIGKEFDYTENDEVYEALIGEEVIAFIHPTTRTVTLNCVHFGGNGCVELSERGMNTLKYRVYADIGRSSNE